MDTSTELWDIVVIGGGPTGINIAVESKKAGLSCLIIEKGMLVNSLFHFPSNMTFFYRYGDSGGRGQLDRRACVVRQHRRRYRDELLRLHKVVRSR